jgi:hypothetical protein
MKKNKNEYTTVATSRIMFQNTYDSDKNVTVKFSVNRSQILTFEAWISHDKEGNNIIESGTVELKIGEANIAKKSKTKLLPQAGAKVPVENTVAQLKNLCCNGLKNRDRSKKMRIQIYEQIRKQKKLIETCGNPRDFAEPLLSGLRDELNTEFRHAVIPVARKISKHWTEIERKELARICERILKASIQDQLVIGNDSNTSVNGEAIITLGVVGDEKQISILPEFESNTKYRHSLLCAYGSAGIRADWILKKFNDDADHHNKQIQESVKALGAVIRNGGRFNAKEREETVDRLIQFIESFPENKSNLVLALISLGYCCNIEDRQEVLDKAAEAIDDMPNYYSYMSDVLSYAKQAISIAKRLINKEEISSEDEEYLLFKFDSDSEI